MSQEKDLSMTPFIYELETFITWILSMMPSDCEEGMEVDEEMLFSDQLGHFAMLREGDLKEISLGARDIVRYAEDYELGQYLPKVERLKNESADNVNIKYRTGLHLPVRSVPKEYLIRTVPTKERLRAPCHSGSSIGGHTVWRRRYQECQRKQAGTGGVTVIVITQA